MARSRAVVVGVVCVGLLAGCSRSLFDAHGDDDGRVSDGGPDGGPDDVPDTCEAPCLGDAAAAFDGSLHGSDGHWSYVSDRRNHTWPAMTLAQGAMVGDAANRIERCTDQPSATACRELPDALLVTSSGTSSASDPAIEYTTNEARVVEISLRARIPGDSAEHRVRLYRNSREDVLFTAITAPGNTVARNITVDALASDRFVVALEPTGAGGPSAVQVFVTDPGTPFPSTCQLALEFSAADVSGTAVDDLCRGTFTSISNSQPMMPYLQSGPFDRQGTGIYLEPGLHVRGSQPLPGGDVTVQFWLLYDVSSNDKAAVFSDIDQSTGTGLAVQIDRTSGVTLEAAVIGTTSPVSYVSQRITYGTPAMWHFVRVVHAGGTATFCVDGTRVASLPLASSTAMAAPAYIGQNGPWFPSNELSGVVDDVRVFSEALPCN